MLFSIHTVLIIEEALYIARNIKDLKYFFYCEIKIITKIVAMAPGHVNNNANSNAKLSISTPGNNRLPSASMSTFSNGKWYCQVFLSCNAKTILLSLFRHTYIYVKARFIWFLLAPLKFLASLFCRFCCHQLLWEKCFFF